MSSLLFSSIIFASAISDWILSFSTHIYSSYSRSLAAQKANKSDGDEGEIWIFDDRGESIETILPYISIPICGIASSECSYIFSECAIVVSRKKCKIIKV